MRKRSLLLFPGSDSNCVRIWRFRHKSQHLKRNDVQGRSHLLKPPLRVAYQSSLISSFCWDQEAFETAAHAEEGSGTWFTYPRSHTSCLHTGLLGMAQNQQTKKRKKKKRDSVRPHKHKSSFSHKPAHTHTYPVIKPTGKLCHSINVSFYLVLTYLPSSAGIKASPLSPPSLPSPSCTHFLSLSLFNSLSLSLSSCTQCAGLSTVVITSILKKNAGLGFLTFTKTS